MDIADIAVMVLYHYRTFDKIKPKNTERVKNKDLVRKIWSMVK
jgi:hypothetical protein